MHNFKFDEKFGKKKPYKMKPILLVRGYLLNSAPWRTLPTWCANFRIAIHTVARNGSAMDEIYEVDQAKGDK